MACKVVLNGTVLNQCEMVLFGIALDQDRCEMVHLGMVPVL